jgi:uncharacterized membrane protein YkvA (DUF1232 family)
VRRRDEAVPGPPRGRRRRLGGDVRARVAAMRSGELAGPDLAVLLRLSGEVILLLKDLARDPRVPLRAKLVAAAAAGYLMSPLDVVPDVLPVVGQLDDLLVVVVAVRHLLAAACYEVVYDLWRGSDEGLALVLSLSGAQAEGGWDPTRGRE